MLGTVMHIHAQSRMAKTHTKYTYIVIGESQPCVDRA